MRYYDMYCEKKKLFVFKKKHYRKRKQRPPYRTLIFWTDFKNIVFFSHSRTMYIILLFFSFRLESNERITKMFLFLDSSCLMYFLNSIPFKIASIHFSDRFFSFTLNCDCTVFTTNHTYLLGMSLEIVHLRRSINRNSHQLAKIFSLYVYNDTLNETEVNHIDLFMCFT